MSDEPNEIVATAKAAKDHKDAAGEAAPDKAKSWPVAAFGVGVGVGSAAVAAAMLFANRQRSRK